MKINNWIMKGNLHYLPIQEVILLSFTLLNLHRKYFCTRIVHTNCKDY